MKKLRNLLNTILRGLAGISFLAMVVLTCWQVFTRYILKSPSTWSEELVPYLFAWASLMGAAIVTSERGHMNIPILVERCSKSGQKVLNCLCELIAFIFSAVILVYGGIQISTLAMGQMTSSLGVPIGIFYIVLPLCGILNMIYTVMNMVEIVKGTEAEGEVK